MRLLIPILLALGCASCVTGGDLREMADHVDALEATLDDEYATAEEVEAAFTEAREGIEAVAAGVEERTRGVIGGISQGAEGGLVGVIAALGLHLYRNHTRKKLIVETEEA